MGILKRAIAKDASVVATAVDATDIVAEIEKIHQNICGSYGGIGAVVHCGKYDGL